MSQAKAQLQAPDCDVQHTLQGLHARLAQLKVAPRLAAETKELHGSVSKLSKVVEKSFSLDVCKAVRLQDLDQAALNQARQGALCGLAWPAVLAACLQRACHS